MEIQGFIDSAVIKFRTVINSMCGNTRSEPDLDLTSVIANRTSSAGLSEDSLIFPRFLKNLSQILITKIFARLSIPDQRDSNKLANWT